MTVPIIVANHGDAACASVSALIEEWPLILRS